MPKAERMAADKIETRLYSDEHLSAGRSVGLDHARAHFLRSVLRLRTAASEAEQ